MMETGIEDCYRMVTSVFPDISPDYAKQISLEHSGDSGSAISAIMDNLEQNTPYPKKPIVSLKRKRDGNSEEADPRMTELKKKYANVSLREKAQSAEDIAFVEQVLSKHFIYLPHDIISQTMHQFDNLLLPTYLDLEEKLRKWDTYDQKPWPNLTEETPNASTQHLSDLVKDTNSIRPTACDAAGVLKSSVYRELLSAIRIRNSRIKKSESEKAEKAEEERLDQEALANGFIGECGCCFVEFPLHRMVQCNGLQEHMFCSQCARRNAEEQVGLFRWELQCMSTDRCPGGFSHHERGKFLDSKLMEALDCIETGSAVNLAGLTLTTCPYCPFAAEYPPVEQDREFYCKNETCLKISCRLCNKETHVPKTCDEARNDDDSSARLKIEEAMSSAMIRLCNKCKTPFIKDMGCNKMTCPVRTCRNMQCYICSQNCDYKHFSQRHSSTQDSTKCPLYDNSEDRHEQEVKKAQEESTKEVQSERPDVTAESLEINMSAVVREDEERRRQMFHSRPRAHRRAHAAEIAAALGVVREQRRIQAQIQHPAQPMQPVLGIGGQITAQDVHAQLQALLGFPVPQPPVPAVQSGPVVQHPLGVQPPAPPRPVAAVPALSELPGFPPDLAEALGAARIPMMPQVNEFRDGPGQMNGLLGLFRHRHQSEPKLQTAAGDGHHADGSQIANGQLPIMPGTAVGRRLIAPWRQAPILPTNQPLQFEGQTRLPLEPERNGGTASIHQRDIFLNRAQRLRTRADYVRGVMPAQTGQPRWPGPESEQPRAQDGCTHGERKGNGAPARPARYVPHPNFDFNDPEMRYYNEQRERIIANRLFQVRPELGLPATTMRRVTRANSAFPPHPARNSS